jgi:GT2 family glycosyltransferase
MPSIGHIKQKDNFQPMIINIVLVVYNRDIDRSETYRSLFESSNNLSNIKLIIYDNGRIGQELSFSDSVNISYLHDASNPGLAAAYNYALSTIVDQNDWMLLLDQDSKLPTDFISRLIETINKIADESIVAIAPHIVCKNTFVSPLKVGFGGRLLALPEWYTGASAVELMGINSGMAVRVSFMKQVGGFNQEFWLDYLDHWLCRTIYAKGKKLYVSSSIVNHDLSVSNYNEVSEERAINILNAELIFYTKYKSKAEQIVYLFRLIARGIKQFMFLKNKSISCFSLKSALIIAKKIV